MSTPEPEGDQLDPMVAAGADPADVDAYWQTVTDPQTFDANDW